MSRRKLLGPTLVLAVCTLAAFPEPALANPHAVGRWEGSVPSSPLEVQVDLVLDEAGGWKGTIDIPAQRMNDFRLSDVAVEGAKVSFAMSGVPGNPSFRGTLSEDSRRISGTFTQGGARFPFMLEKSAEVEAEDLGPNQAAPEVTGVPGKGFAGIWLGVLETPQVDLRLRVRIAESEDGALRGTMDSIDQGATGLKITSIAAEGRSIRFEIKKVKASFEGALNG